MKERRSIADVDGTRFLIRRTQEPYSSRANIRTGTPSIGYIDEHTLHHQVLIDTLRTTFSAESASFDSAERALARGEHTNVDTDHAELAYR